jgi:hypothetical protein
MIKTENTKCTYIIKSEVIRRNIFVSWWSCSETASCSVCMIKHSEACHMFRTAPVINAESSRPSQAAEKDQVFLTQKRTMHRNPLRPAKASYAS